MNRGKTICNQLKEVRKHIAEENGIPLEMEECTYKGECRGTCPRCEAEVRYLENALAERLRIGKVATVAGLALGLATAAQAQTPADSIPRQREDTVRTEEMRRLEWQPTLAQPEDPEALYSAFPIQEWWPPHPRGMVVAEISVILNGTPASIRGDEFDNARSYGAKKEDGVKVVVR